MATVRGAWKRTVQTRPYESLTLELSVEDEVPHDASTEALVALSAAMTRQLSDAGDQVVAERLTLFASERLALLASASPSSAPPAERSEGPVDPDPFLDGKKQP